MLILPPYQVGETVTLYTPREYVCTVTDPSGAMQTIDSDSKRTDIALTMVGVYRYEFPDGTTGEVIVNEAPGPVVVP